MRVKRAHMKNMSTDGSRREQIGVGGCRITPRAKELVMAVLDSNRLTAGPMMAKFENEMAAIHGCRFA